MPDSSPLPIIEIEIGGQKRPLRYGNAARFMYDDLRPESLQDLALRAEEALSRGDAVPMNTAEVITVVYVGLKDGARKRAKEGEQPPRSPSSELDVADWLDDAGPERMEKIIERCMQHFTGPDASQNADSSKAQPGNTSAAEPKTQPEAQSQTRPATP